MKLPLSWIQDIIDITLFPQQIGDLLTQAGLEVDSIEPLPMGFEKVVVAEVLKTERHPGADKLCVATVTDGSETYQVVCGAPNCREGLKTAYAMVGSKLLNDKGETFKVKKGKLRGVESLGMLCSQQELGLGDDHEGIMEFADQVSVGADIAEIYGDTIFDISLTPNLGHCASVIGVARELSAATEKPCRIPQVDVNEEASATVDDIAAVIVENKDKCPRYACRMIKGVKVGPSPDWIQKRLVACDMRPVNNIVDITNYVLMEYGHPLHAFDADLVDDQKIIVRSAKEGETITTLDDIERKLTTDDLLICDPKKPIALAGVMGGGNSEVSEQTVNVLLESAYFCPQSVRKTSKSQGLTTEASRRFERGTDPNNVITALNRAAQLMAELAEGTICSGVIDIKERTFDPINVTCRLSRINQVLGTQLSLSEVEGIFHRLEMITSWDGNDTFTVNPPTYRVDIDSEIDLIEEVARIYGFDNIPKPTPKFIASTLPDAPIYLFENQMRDTLIGEGLQEFLTCDLVGPTLLNVVRDVAIPKESEVAVLNPTSIEQSVLRTSLLPGLLQVVKHNYDNECHNVSGFEIGRIHFKNDDQYREQSFAGVIMTGKVRPQHWDRKAEEVDFYDIKGVVENLIDSVGASKPKFRNDNVTVFHPGRQATVIIDDIEIGRVGEVHPEVRRRLDVPQRIYFAEIDLHDLFRFQGKDAQMKSLPVYPASDRDLTVTLPTEVTADQVLEKIESIHSRLLEKVSIIDLFQSEKLGAGKKNVTFHFVYRNNKKTVAQEAVDAEHARITAQVESLLGGC